jgi:hypothetical protein
MKPSGPDHTRCFKALTPEAIEPAGIGDESTDGYVIFPTDPTEFESSIEASDAVDTLTRFAKRLGDGSTDLDLAKLQHNLAARVHAATLGGERTLLFTWTADGLAMVSDHPIGSDSEHQRCADFVLDVQKLTDQLAPSERQTTVCVDEKTAYVVVADSGWVAVRVHPTRQVGFLLASIDRIADLLEE